MVIGQVILFEQLHQYCRVFIPRMPHADQGLCAVTTSNTTTTSKTTREWRNFTSGFDLGRESRDVCFFEAFLFVFCRLLIPSFISTNQWRRQLDK